MFEFINPGPCQKYGRATIDITDRLIRRPQCLTAEQRRPRHGPLPEIHAPDRNVPVTINCVKIGFSDTGLASTGEQSVMTSLFVTALSTMVKRNSLLHCYRSWCPCPAGQSCNVATTRVPGQRIVIIATLEILNVVARSPLVFYVPANRRLTVAAVLHGNIGGRINEGSTLACAILHGADLGDNPISTRWRSTIPYSYPHNCPESGCSITVELIPYEGTPCLGDYPISRNILI